MAGRRLKLAYKRYRLPFCQPVRTAHGLWSEREGVLIRLTGEDGAAHYGEAAPIPWFGTGSADEVEEILGGLGEWVTEETLAALPAAQPTLRFAVHTALSPAPIAAHAHLQVAALLPAGRAALALLEQRLEAWFRVFKWKVGAGDAADERVLLDDVLARLPEGARLRLDANGAWDRREAERWLACTAERPVEFVEQPVAIGSDDLLLGLASDWPTTLGLDESLAADADVERWLGMGWPGVYVLKPTLLAEPDTVMASLAKAGADVVFSSALETAVAARAALRFAFAWPARARALGFGVWPLFELRACNGPQAAPFLRAGDVETIDVAAAWDALG